MRMHACCTLHMYYSTTRAADSMLQLFCRVSGCRARCVKGARKELSQIMAKLRGGTAELRVEIGR